MCRIKFLLLVLTGLYDFYGFAQGGAGYKNSTEAGNASAYTTITETLNCKLP